LCRIILPSAPESRSFGACAEGVCRFTTPEEAALPWDAAGQDQVREG